MVAEVRARVSTKTQSQLSELRSYLGLAKTGELLQWLASDAHERLLGRTRWEQQQRHAHAVLCRLKPQLLIQVNEVTGVSFADNGNRVLISVALNSQPYQVSKQEWER